MARARGEQGFSALISQLISDGKSWLAAEADLFRAQVRVSVGELRTAAIAMVAAAVFALAGLIIAGVTLVNLLATLIGPHWAGLCIAAGFLLVALILVKYCAGAVDRAGKVAHRIGAIVQGDRS